MMTPQLRAMMTLVGVASADPFIDDVSLQLPNPSQTLSVIPQMAPGALQSIGGKLGNCPF